jgi:hypothetical protein
MMTYQECAFEDEVLAAALQSRWPERVPAELRKHVEACAICRDLAEVAGAVNAAREEMNAAIVVPDAGRIWWMTQLRVRREAIRTAGRPITAVHVVALGCAAGLAGACFGASSAWFQSALRWVSAFSLSTLWNSVGGTLVPSARTLVIEHGAMAGMIAMLLLVLPAAVYLAIGRD